MKKNILFAIIAFAIISCTNSVQLNQLYEESSSESWIILNYIKYDKKQEFEDIFLNEAMPSWYSYRDSIDELHSLNQKAKKTFRFQKPVEMNQDSTWTFTMMADPYFDGANYSIIPPLRQKYGDEKAKEIYGRWNACFDKQGQNVFLVEEIDLQVK